MNAPRFSFGQPATPQDSEILRRCSHVKIDLHVDEDRDIHGEIVLSIGVGAFDPLREKHIMPEEFERQQNDSMRFVRSVLAAIQKKPDAGGEEPRRG